MRKVYVVLALFMLGALTLPVMVVLAHSAEGVLEAKEPDYGGEWVRHRLGGQTVKTEKILYDREHWGKNHWMRHKNGVVVFTTFEKGVE